MPKLFFVICKVIGFGLLFMSWIQSGEATGFFPIMALGIMTVLRHRLPKWWYTIAVDAFILLLLEEYLPLSIFVVSEIFYRAWEKERKHGLKLRDEQAQKYYELEQLQGDLLTATAQIERMTVVSERARIARDIHDNAGHEIIGAYISLQTVRELLGEGVKDAGDSKKVGNSERFGDSKEVRDSERFGDSEVLELYDAALSRLDSGVIKIREAVHNLAPLTALSADALRETCSRFPVCEVQFTTYGDLGAVPIYCWNLLEACLNEALTNIARHADATFVKVDLDATPNLVRLAIENDGVKTKNDGVKTKDVSAGIGLKNLRHRAAAVGGNISVDTGEVFRVICVISLKESG